MAPGILFVETSTADVAVLYHQREKKKNDSIYDSSFIFRIDYWFVVCFRFLTWAFPSVYPMPPGSVQSCDTLTHDSGCLSAFPTLPNRTSLLFFVPTRQIGTWKSATRSDFVKARTAVMEKLGRTTTHFKESLLGIRTNLVRNLIVNTQSRIMKKNQEVTMYGESIVKSRGKNGGCKMTK